MATQYDIPWREDLFQGFHFYDVSQSLEFQRAGYLIGIPNQANLWCIHYNGDEFDADTYEVPESVCRTLQRYIISIIKERCKVKGIILAGGTGSRLYPITKVTNKHLLPVGRYPMIYHAVYKLKQCDITDIMIITGKEHMGMLLAFRERSRVWRVLYVSCAR